MSGLSTNAEDLNQYFNTSSPEYVILRGAVLNITGLPQSSFQLLSITAAGASRRRLTTGAVVDFLTIAPTYSVETGKVDPQEIYEDLSQKLEEATTPSTVSGQKSPMEFLLANPPEEVLEELAVVAPSAANPYENVETEAASVLEPVFEVKNTAAPTSMPTLSPPPGDDGAADTGTIVGAAVGALAGLGALAAVFYYFYWMPQQSSKGMDVRDSAHSDVEYGHGHEHVKHISTAQPSTRRERRASALAEKPGGESKGSGDKIVQMVAVTNPLTRK
jgi:hypothetical protein